MCHNVLHLWLMISLDVENSLHRNDTICIYAAWITVELDGKILHVHALRKPPPQPGRLTLNGTCRSSMPNLIFNYKYIFVQFA